VFVAEAVAGWAVLHREDTLVYMSMVCLPQCPWRLFNADSVSSPRGVSKYVAFEQVSYFNSSVKQWKNTHMIGGLQ
jgi:hypothetical protein